MAPKGIRQDHVGDPNGVNVLPLGAFWRARDRNRGRRDVRLAREWIALTLHDRLSVLVLLEPKDRNRRVVARLLCLRPLLITDPIPIPRIRLLRDPIPVHNSNDSVAGV